METPSSVRRVTRSQTKATFANSSISRTKVEDSDNKGATKSIQRTAKQDDRSALIDITNDSPIVGLASGNLNNDETPMSSVSKQRSIRYKRTPGSGEALLRGQVKNLLQKVEEEAEISKFSLGSSGAGRLRHGLEALLNSPAGLLAPTPANTPQVFSFSSALDEFESLGSVLESPIEDQLTLSQMVSGSFEGKKQADNELESEKDLLSRSLFLDFTEKSDSSSDCSSVVTVEKGSQGKSPLKDDDDDASIWSIQVNASTRDEEEDEDEVIQDDLEEAIDDDEDGEECVEEEGDLDELCEGMMNINVNGEKIGKHTRFVYDSDDELVKVDEVLHLNGLPTPKGKHLRFQDEEDE